MHSPPEHIFEPPAESGTLTPISYGLEAGKTSVLAAIVGAETRGVGVVIGIAVCAAFYYGVRLLGVAVGTSVMMLVVLVVAVLATVWWIGRRSSAKAIAGGNRERPDQSMRVGCAGIGPRLAALRRRGEIADVAFEPVVVRGVATFKQNWQGSWVYWIAIPFWFGFFWLINMLTGLRLNVFTVAYLALTLAAIVPPLIYPIYARVVPGRIDILRSGVFNRTLRTCETFDLRGAAVLVDLNQRCVFVCRDDETREIGFGYVFDKPGFAHAVLLAAVSTHTPAPLPDDALIG